MDIYAGKGSIAHFLQLDIIHGYTWRRWDERSEQIRLTNYIVVDEKLKKDVLNTKVVRGKFDRSDQYAAVAKIKIR